MHDLVLYLLLKGLDAELVELRDRLKFSVSSSIRACPDTAHAERAALDMIDAAFSRFRGTRGQKARKP
jgi:hypothetical protein